jgi:ankyrin repeat protein
MFHSRYRSRTSDLQIIATTLKLCNLTPSWHTVLINKSSTTHAGPQICERRPCAALDANEYGDTPAHLAAAAGRLPAVYLLAERQPEVLAADNHAGKVKAECCNSLTPPPPHNVSPLPTP